MGNKLFLIIIFILTAFLFTLKAQDIDGANQEGEFLEDETDEFEGTGPNAPTLAVQLALEKACNANGCDERYGQAVFNWKDTSDGFGGSTLSGTVDIRLRKEDSSLVLVETIGAPVESNLRLTAIRSFKGNLVQSPTTIETENLCVEVSNWNLETSKGISFKIMDPIVYCPNSQKNSTDMAVRLEPNSVKSLVLGQRSSIVIAVQNLGPQIATHPRIKLSLPSNLKFLSDNSEGFDCTERSFGIVECLANQSDFPPQSRGLSINVLAKEKGTGHVSLTISSGAQDTSVNNNVLSTPIEVIAVPPINSLSLASNDLWITEDDTVVLSADGSGMAQVEFYEDELLLARYENPDISRPFIPTHHINITAKDNGTHIYTATAKDYESNSLSSKPIKVNVTIGNSSECSIKPSLPNIILILSDDQTYDDLFFMPNTLQYLAEEGTSFINAFVPEANCCPSRASILRSQYPHNHGVLSSHYPFGGYGQFYQLGHETSTLATWLQDAGYYTGLIGKYLNQYPVISLENSLGDTYIPPGWNEWYALHGNQYYKYKMSKNGYGRYYGNEPDDYSTDRINRILTGFIQRNACSANPFFVYYNPLTPHAPFIPADRHKNLFSDLQIPRTPSFNEADITDKPSWMQRTREVNVSALDEKYRKRLQMLQSLDESIDDLISILEAKGILNNTIILFTSDNGYKLGQHRFVGKMLAYEEDIHVPLLIRGPGIPKGEIRDQLTLNIDIAPTLLDIANVAHPAFIDGKSLLPIIKDATLESFRKAMLFQYWNPRTDQPLYSAVRTDTYKLTEWYTRRNGRPLPAPQYELYNLTLDPYEVNNIYKTSDQELINDLKRYLNVLKTCQGNACYE